MSIPKHAETVRLITREQTGLDLAGLVCPAIMGYAYGTASVVFSDKRSGNCVPRS